MSEQNTSIARITFTLDLEDHLHGQSCEKRYVNITLQLLDYLDEADIRGTFFVVGNLAQTDQALVRRIADSGHELGCHSFDHTPLPLQTPDQFRQHTVMARDIIEQASGQKIQGYRAPVFSLTKESLWAIEILQDLGFIYSSSVLPAANPLYGYPRAPKTPFRWPNGLLELPAPVAKIGPLTIPFLGGIYFRYLPTLFVNKKLKSNAKNACLWLYCHPYDFDPHEPYSRIQGTNFATSVLIWMNRTHTWAKLQRLFSSPEYITAEPFIERVAKGEFDEVQTFAV